VDAASIRVSLGWTNARTQAVYTHVGDLALKEVAKAVDELLPAPVPATEARRSRS
jgi:hypothetical protein